jgi:hypothetical protein
LAGCGDISGNDVGITSALERALSGQIVARCGYSPTRMMAMDSRD